MEQYPDTEKQRGISPWFRIGLLNTYPRGVRVGLGWYSLRQEVLGRRWFDPRAPLSGPQWRLLGDQETRAEGEENCLLVGHIRFDSIEEVIWQGDEHYPFPHLYCYFDGPGKMPYERLSFCQKHQNPGGRPFYTEVAEQRAVWSNTRRAGVKSSYL